MFGITVVNGFCKAMCYLDSLSKKTKFIIGGTGAAALLAMASPAGAIAVVGE